MTAAPNRVTAFSRPKRDRVQPPSSADTAKSLPPRNDHVSLSGMDVLLSVEQQIRSARDESELVHLIVNETRKIVPARQILVLRAHRGGHFRVECVSSLALTDGDTPFVRWIQSMVASLVKQQGAERAVEFALPAFTDPESSETKSYPFPHFVWQPLKLSSGHVFAGLLFARERPWLEPDVKLIERQAGVFSSAWQALHGAKALKPKRPLRGWLWLLAAVAVLIAGAVPVPMTTLAPVEIIADKPQLVTAPIDGIIEEILVEPNRPVKVGEPLLRFDTTTLQNGFMLAQREMLVAQARHERARQAAFSDQQARHQLAIARNEFELKQAERDYAATLLDRAMVRAERDGVLIYADKDRWLGRPIKAGERIMQIADPSQIVARIDLPVADAIVLEKSAHVRLFLDSAPLTALPARLISEGYHAEPTSTQQLVYKLHADIEGDGNGLRIGARGTAQLQGETVPFGFFLFRRPISAVRQYLGL